MNWPMTQSRGSHQYCHWLVSCWRQSWQQVLWDSLRLNSDWMGWSWFCQLSCCMLLPFLQDAFWADSFDCPKRKAGQCQLKQVCTGFSCFCWVKYYCKCGGGHELITCTPTNRISWTILGYVEPPGVHLQCRVKNCPFVVKSRLNVVVWWEYIEIWLQSYAWQKTRVPCLVLKLIFKWTRLFCIFSSINGCLSSYI